MTNILWNTDGYKPSHIYQYPPGFSGYYGYMEARSTKKFDKLVVFGYQIAILREIAGKMPTLPQVMEAASKFKKMGIPFDLDSWLALIRKYPKEFPVEIRAIPEGSIIPVGTPFLTVKTTDDEFPWVAGYIESILVRNWYPCTVATLSYEIKKLIRSYAITDGSYSEKMLQIKLHDFGARGASSSESAAIGGAAHLLNFTGSDTLISSDIIQNVYMDDPSDFIRTIPAAEHSTITSWGKEAEIDAYRNLLARFKSNGIFAVVIDSYDMYNAAENLWGDELKEDVLNSGAHIVLRPDSGDPVEVVCKLADILAAKFGVTVNALGFKTLKNVGIIQGDGVNYNSIKDILDALHAKKFSSANICFGMGSALLQDVRRDDLGFAFKMSSITLHGSLKRPVFKDPITDQGKRSKHGEVTVRRDFDGSFKTYCNGTENHPSYLPSAMEKVYDSSGVVKLETFKTIRDRLSKFDTEQRGG